MLWHRNSRQASGGDHLRVHAENYAPISAPHLWFPHNALYSLDRFCFIIRTLAKTAKTSTIVGQTLSAVEKDYIDPCVVIHALTYD